MKSHDFSTDGSLAALRAFHDGGKEASRFLKAEGVVEAMRREAAARVISALRERGIDPLIFKGTALAYTVYQRPELRARCDTDLFLPVCRDVEVREVMEALDYELVPATSGKWIRHQFCYRTIDDLGFPQLFDFHRRISDPVLFAGLYDYESLLRESTEIPGLGRAVGAVDAVIIACVHQIAHHPSENDPLWLYDLDRLVARRDDGFWDALWRRAEEKRVVSLVDYGLSRAAERWGTPIRRVPVPWREPSALYLRHGRSSAFRVAMDLACLPGWRARAEYLGEHLFPPAEFILAKYGENRRARLPALYLRRLLNGWRRVT